MANGWPSVYLKNSCALTGSSQFCHSDARKKTASRFIPGVAGHKVINLLEQEVGQSDVDFVTFAEVGG